MIRHFRTWRLKNIFGQVDIISEHYFFLLHDIDHNISPDEIKSGIRLDEKIFSWKIFYEKMYLLKDPVKKKQLWTEINYFKQLLYLY